LYGRIDIGCLGPYFIRKLPDGIGAARIGDTHAVALLAPSASDSSPYLANANNTNLHDFTFLVFLSKKRAP
jgi:hypothetical protein